MYTLNIKNVRNDEDDDDALNLFDPSSEGIIARSNGLFLPTEGGEREQRWLYVIS